MTKSRECRSKRGQESRCLCLLLNHRKPPTRWRDIYHIFSPNTCLSFSVIHLRFSQWLLLTTTRSPILCPQQILCRYLPHAIASIRLFMWCESHQINLLLWRFHHSNPVICDRVWITLSSAVILFNKWILDPETINFRS